MAQPQVNGSTDEPKKSLRLLRAIDLRGMVVSGDAMFAKQDLSPQIVQAQGDYLWTVKGNQGRLYDEIQTLFEQMGNHRGWSAPPMDFRPAQTIEKGK